MGKNLICIFFCNDWINLIASCSLDKDKDAPCETDSENQIKKWKLVHTYSQETKIWKKIQKEYKKTNIYELSWVYGKIRAVKLPHIA